MPSVRRSGLYLSFATVEVQTLSSFIRGLGEDHGNRERMGGIYYVSGTTRRLI
jgi:hypothetical protein